MATRLLRVCDVCEQPIEGESIRFGWGGGFYETDLCEKHGEELRSTMERYLRKARRLGAAPKSAPIRSAPSAAGTKRTRRRPTVSTKEVREWAAKEGIDVSERGRVPESLIAQFLEARP